jgi:hypothetical protein
MILLVCRGWQAVDARRVRKGLVFGGEQLENEKEHWQGFAAAMASVLKMEELS